MKRGADKYAVLAVLLCVIVFAGEVSTYAPVHEYGSDAEWKDGCVDFTVSSSGSDTYSAVLFDHNGSVPVEKLYIFVDENYSKHYKAVGGPDGVPFIDQQYYSEQIRKALLHRGFGSVELCDSAGLADAVAATSADPRGVGILVMSYALPSDVYRGYGDDPILEWIRNGGMLYWLGSVVGGFSSDADGITYIADSQQVFFGKECINTGDTDLALETADGPFTDALSLKNSSLRFAMDADGLENGLEMGYVSDGYATISMASVGKGAVCVFAGSFDIKQMDDVGQVIASGVTPTTEIVETVTSEVTRGTSSGTIVFSCDHPSLYIYIGGTYTKYGGTYSV